MDVAQRERGTYVFGRFRLDPLQRTLHRAGDAVSLTSRLFDTLLYLVQNPERLVTRDELENAVWHGRSVEDGNLQKAVAALRKVLYAEDSSANLIVTVTGRGFQFAAPVEFEPYLAEASHLSALAAPGLADTVIPAVAGWWRRGNMMALAVAALLLAGIGLWSVAGRRTLGTADFSPPAHSVAVMAFTNLSGDAGQEYFSDGLSEELIDTLGRIPMLRVAAPLSSFSFKGKQVPADRIGRELNVGAILEGSVRRQANTLRITAQLVDARTGYMIWSSRYEGDPGDVFKVQGSIAEAVATALQVSMVGDDATRMSIGGTNNPKAFDAYLLGMKLHNERTPASIKQARASFSQALALDPHYALAHVRRVSCLILICEGFAEAETGDGDTKSILASARAEARLAVVLAPNLGAAHTILGNALEVSGYFVEAGMEHARALQLAPGDPWVNTMYGLYQQFVGHVALGQAAAQRGTELDPLSAEAFLTLAEALINDRKPERALTALQRAEQLGLIGPEVSYFRSWAELEQGNAAAAKRDCTNGDVKGVEQCIAIADHMLGQQADAEAELTRMRARWGDEAALSYARIYAQWGQPEQALHWLEVASARHDEALLELRIDSWLDPIRNTPRFKAIEATLHFPP